jgi:hypothetical protein
MKATVVAGKLIVLVSALTICTAHYESISGNLKRPGPQYVPTKGEPWPKPQLRSNYGKNFMILRPAGFRFEVSQDKINTYIDAYILVINMCIGRHPTIL